MLKVVVFDGGYGGEFFADKLAEALPVIEIIRVIDWRNAEKILSSPRAARKTAETALRPYIGRVDLIIFANHLLTLTSLRYFRRKYKKQNFIGLNLKAPETFIKNDVLILTTSAVSRTMRYRLFTFRLRRHIATLNVDSWPIKIDDGELTEQEVAETINNALINKKASPKEVILACSQFNDIKPALRKALGHNLKIYESFGDAIRQTCKVLRIRGGVNKKK